MNILEMQVVVLLRDVIALIWCVLIIILILVGCIVIKIGELIERKKKNMKCYIRRYDTKLDQWKDTYLAPRYNYTTHWVCDRREATLFNSVKEARDFIKKHNLKNCDVYKIN